MKHYKICILTILTILSFSCESQDNITVYQIKKNHLNKSKKTISELKWTSPKNWIKKVPGNMRLASFDAFDANNKISDISITMFPGNVGGIENNVNRWRKQIGLTEQSLEEILKKTEQKEFPLLGDALIFTLNNDKNNKGIIAVMIPNQNKQTIFVKIVGDLNSILELKYEFDLFCQSIYWNN